MNENLAEVTPKSANMIEPNGIYSRQDLNWLCSWITLRRWEKAGKLRRIGRGRIIRYRGSDLLAAMQPTK